MNRVLEHDFTTFSVLHRTKCKQMHFVTGLRLGLGFRFRVTVRVRIRVMVRVRIRV